MINENGIEITCRNCKRTCAENINTNKCLFIANESALKKRIIELSEICDMQTLLIQAYENREREKVIKILSEE